MNSELHPLEPFLPGNARILMLGSFPPKRIRWSMEFFYPNLQNDMWRIVGYLATGDKQHFLLPGGRRFDRGRIEAFCRERGIALYDTAVEVVRLKDNASDNFLQVVREVDLAALLARIPACRAIVTTGQKATDTLRAPSRAATNRPWGRACRCPLRAGSCGCGVCPPRRGLTRVRSSGKPNFTAAFSPRTALSDPLIRPFRAAAGGRETPAGVSVRFWISGPPSPSGSAGRFPFCGFFSAAAAGDPGRKIWPPPFARLPKNRYLCWIIHTIFYCGFGEEN